MNLARLRCFACVLSVFAAACLAGCDATMPTPAQLDQFHQAGPSMLPVDTAGLPIAKVPTGPYKVVPGDVLLISLPFLKDNPYMSTVNPSGAMSQRVDKDGCISLPLVDKI